MRPVSRDTSRGQDVQPRVLPPRMNIGASPVFSVPPCPTVPSATIVSTPLAEGSPLVAGIQSIVVNTGGSFPSPPMTVLPVNQVSQVHSLPSSSAQMTYMAVPLLNARVQQQPAVALFPLLSEQSTASTYNLSAAPHLRPILVHTPLQTHPGLQLPLSTPVSSKSFTESSSASSKPPPILTPYAVSVASKPLLVSSSGSHKRLIRPARPLPNKPYITMTRKPIPKYVTLTHASLASSKTTSGVVTMTRRSLSVAPAMSSKRPFGSTPHSASLSSGHPVRLQGPKPISLKLPLLPKPRPPNTVTVTRKFFSQSKATHRSTPTISLSPFQRRASTPLSSSLSGPRFQYITLTHPSLRHSSLPSFVSPKPPPEVVNLVDSDTSPSPIPPPCHPPSSGEELDLRATDNEKFNSVILEGWSVKEVASTPKYIEVMNNTEAPEFLEYKRQHPLEKMYNLYTARLASRAAGRPDDAHPPPAPSAPVVHRQRQDPSESPPVPVLRSEPSETPSAPSLPSDISLTDPVTPNSCVRIDEFDSLESQERIIELAKQESRVLDRRDELIAKGMWIGEKISRSEEWTIPKAHIDFLHEEAVWMWSDFCQERRTKMRAAKRVAAAARKVFLEKETNAQKLPLDEDIQKKKICAKVAQEIRNFWLDVRTLVEHRTKMLLDHQRRRAMEKHLNRVVETTEKLSSWVTEELAGNALETGTGSDEDESSEFEPDLEDTDDEDTIALEEAQVEGDRSEAKRIREEVCALEFEAQMSHEEFLSLNLPPGYLEARDKIISDEKVKGSDEASAQGPAPSHFSVEGDEAGSNSDWEADVEAAEDDEHTVEEEERLALEDGVDHETEIQQLQAEMDVPIEDLLRQYGNLSPVQPGSSLGGDGDDELESLLGETQNPVHSQSLPGRMTRSRAGGKFAVHTMPEADDEDDDSDGMPDVGLAELLEDISSPNTDRDSKRSPSGKLPGGREIENVAKEAESFQPKGHTLSTQNVLTPVPVLLKHQLREYQHIGLDWLVALAGRKLNGILADEMGLGKTIQTIALIAHLAESGNWGPHLLVVPTSVILNWEMEFKKWSPGLKILTYFGSVKERKQKRTGWTKHNQFHVCITSYKLVVQDHACFRRKKWKYLILDEAQNIKNFKSQRWQLLLDYQTQRRLLLTGTPLQNNLMELWSLMHFLMPQVFGSHREFKEWFDNPMSGMVQGDQEYCETIVKRLHKVLRPFILRRLKSEVEKQLPKKYEHIVPCRLSKRQRFLYEDFMSRAKTKESLASGNITSVFNVLMQLRKVCNHPDLFEARSIVSPFCMSEGIVHPTASLVPRALEYNPFQGIDFSIWNICCRERSVDSLPSLMTKHLASSEASSTCLGTSWEFNLRRVPWSTAPHLALATTQEVPSRKTPVCIQFARANGLQATDYDLWKSQLADRLLSYPATPMPSSEGRSEGPRVSHLFASSVDEEVLRDERQQKWASLAQQIRSMALARERERVASEEDSSEEAEEEEAPGSLAFYRKRKQLEEAQSRSIRLPPINAVDLDVEATERERRLAHFLELNRWRCSEVFLIPCYGQDEIALLRKLAVESCLPCYKTMKCNRFHSGFSCIQSATSRRSLHPFLKSSAALQNAILGPEDILDSLCDVLQRFMIVIPRVFASSATLHVSHPSSQFVNANKRLRQMAEHYLKAKTALLHPILLAQSMILPELRLIQYDCGKLQALNDLLRDLKVGSHRVLIFTQMTRMLDILEAFLNYHGYLYLRLDGTTKVEQRQALMERFNADKRIFCFILSTRSGGIGVNLTGADTVIFYDSDWNPTMDAQAQDRCHRIGQTRDVHIYRLISDATVEENILKKAQQKRALGNLAIEDGQFTTEYFRKNQQQLSASRQATIQDLFEVTTGKVSQEEFSHILEAVEEEDDVRASQAIQAEVATELAEFDETIPLMTEVDEEIARKDQEFENMLQELAPVELYAYRWMDGEASEWREQQIRTMDSEIEQQRRDWELRHAQALRLGKAEERRSEGETPPPPLKRKRGRLPKNSLSPATTPLKKSAEIVRQNFPVKNQPLVGPSSELPKRGVEVDGFLAAPGQIEDAEAHPSESEGKPLLKGKAGPSKKPVLSDPRASSIPNGSLLEPANATKNEKKKPLGVSLSPGIKRARTSADSAPRTRAKGKVDIDLWSLDENPLPGASRSGAASGRRKLAPSAGSAQLRVNTRHRSIQRDEHS